MPAIESMDDILRHLNDSPNHWKITAMQQVKTVGCSPQLLETLGRLLSDPSWRIRRNAAKALGDCGPAAAGHFDRLFSHLDTKEHFLDHGTGAVAAAKINPDHPKTVNLLRWLILSRKDYEVRRAIVYLPNPAPVLKYWFAGFMKDQLNRYSLFSAETRAGWRKISSIHCKELQQMVPECRHDLRQLNDMINGEWNEAAGHALLEGVIQTWLARPACN